MLRCRSSPSDGVCTICSRTVSAGGCGVVPQPPAAVSSGSRRGKVCSQAAPKVDDLSGEAGRSVFRGRSLRRPCPRLSCLLPFPLPHAFQPCILPGVPLPFRCRMAARGILQSSPSRLRSMGGERLPAVGCCRCRRLSAADRHGRRQPRARARRVICRCRCRRVCIAGCLACGQRLPGREGEEDRPRAGEKTETPQRFIRCGVFSKSLVPAISGNCSSNVSCGAGPRRFPATPAVRSGRPARR